MGRMHTGHPISGWEGVEPEDAVFKKMYQHQPEQILEWKDIVGTLGVIVQGMDIPFDLWHMLVCGATIQHWERWSQDLKFRVAGDGCHVKTTMMIKSNHLLQTCGDSTHLAVGERLHCAEAEIT